VFEAPALSKKMLVLEDVGPEMGTWRPRVAALLGGLAARGIDFEHWQLDTDVGRIYRQETGDAASLQALSRSRSDRSLLVISTGLGIYDGEASPPRPAVWVGLLQRWPSRAWLNPLDDLHAWRPAMREVEEFAWPLTAAGALAAARHLARGQASRRDRSGASLGSRPVAPLDVARLSWLLSLAPRQDPELAELLRQQYCPHAPLATLPQALALAGSRQTLPHPGVGPAAPEVHAFLAAALADSKPPAGTGADLRWRLDRTLESLRAGGSAIELAPLRSELNELAAGPAAALLAQAGGSAGLGRHDERSLRKVLWSRARQEARHDHSDAKRTWAWPRPPELAIALACGAIFFGLGARLEMVTHDVSTRGQVVYTLDLDEQARPQLFRLERNVSAGPVERREMAEMVAWKDGRQITVAKMVLSVGRAWIPTDRLQRAAWYWIRVERGDGKVDLSNLEWLPPLPPPPAVVEPPVAPETTGTLMVEFLYRPSPQKLPEGSPQPPTSYYVSRAGEVMFPGQAGRALQLPTGKWTVSVDASVLNQRVDQQVEIMPGQPTKIDLEIPMIYYPPPPPSNLGTLTVQAEVDGWPADKAQPKLWVNLRHLDGDGGQFKMVAGRTVMLTIGVWELAIDATPETEAARTTVRVIAGDAVTGRIPVRTIPPAGGLPESSDGQGPIASLPDPEPSPPAGMGTLNVEFYDDYADSMEDGFFVLPLDAPKEFTVHWMGGGPPRSPIRQERGVDVVEIPAGEWRVEALFRGKTITRSVVVKPDETTTLRWDLMPTDSMLRVDVTTTERSFGKLSLRIYLGPEAGTESIEIPFSALSKGSSNTEKRVLAQALRTGSRLVLTNGSSDKWAGILAFSLNGQPLFTLEVPKGDGIEAGSRTVSLPEVLASKYALLSSAPPSTPPDLDVR
jgi:hypothetical protein